MSSFASCNVAVADYESNVEASVESVEITPEPTPSPTPTAEPTIEPSPETDEEVINRVEDHIEETFAIQGPDEFVDEYEENVIDETYLDGLDDASDLLTMRMLADDAADAWNIAIDNIMYKLVEVLSEDEAETIQIEQSAWENDIPLQIEEIQAEYADQGSTGSFTASQEVMEIYRNRAIELAVKYYELTEEVVLPPDISEAVG